MVLGPGILGANQTVILRPGEKLPARLNKKGVLVYVDFPERGWVPIKDIDDTLPDAMLSKPVEG